MSEFSAPELDPVSDEALAAFESQVVNDPDGRFTALAKSDGQTICILLSMIKTLREERDDLRLGRAQEFVEAKNALEGVVRKKLDAIIEVLNMYFDFDAEDWDDALPQPEDVWRLYRDLKAIIRPEGVQ